MNLKEPLLIRIQILAEDSLAESSSGVNELQKAGGAYCDAEDLWGAFRVSRLPALAYIVIERHDLPSLATPNSPRAQAHSGDQYPINVCQRAAAPPASRWRCRIRSIPSSTSRGTAPRPPAPQHDRRGQRGHQSYPLRRKSPRSSGQFLPKLQRVPEPLPNWPVLPSAPSVSPRGVRKNDMDNTSKSHSGSPKRSPVPGQNPAPSQSPITRMTDLAPTIALHRALGAAHLMHPGGPSHNPNRDTRKEMDHQADARIPPHQAC